MAMPLRPVVRVQDGPAASGLNRTAFFAFMKKGLMPRGFLIGERSKALYADEIATVTAARAAGQTDDQIRALVQRLEAARQEVTS